MLCRNESAGKMRREERSNADLANHIWTGQESATDFRQARGEDAINDMKN